MTMYEKILREAIYLRGDLMSIESYGEEVYQALDSFIEELENEILES